MINDINILVQVDMSEAQADELRMMLAKVVRLIVEKMPGESAVGSRLNVKRRVIVNAD